MSTAILPLPPSFRVEPAPTPCDGDSWCADPVQAFYIDGEGAHRRVGDERFGPGTATLHGLTAVVHHLVAAAGTDGLTLVEIRSRLCTALGRDLGPRSSHLLRTTVMNQHGDGFLAAHYQVVQSEVAGWGTSTLDAVRVFTLPRFAPPRELYAGFQLPSLPRCFRGPINPATLHPAGAKTFFARHQGPILLDPRISLIRRQAAPIDVLLKIGPSLIQRRLSQRGPRAFPVRH